MDDFVPDLRATADHIRRNARIWLAQAASWDQAECSMTATQREFFGVRDPAEKAAQLRRAAALADGAATRMLRAGA